MEGLSIQVPIPVFANMTDKLREELLSAEFQKLESLEAQLIAVQNYSQTDPDQHQRQQHLLNQYDGCQTRVTKIEEAGAGAKFMLKVLQGHVALKVGDNLVDTLNAEILVEDGVISEICSFRPSD